MAKKLYSFSASKTNQNKDMPLFLTKYVITFILPDALKAKYGSEILSEAINEIDGMEFDKMPEPVEQKYKGISRRFGGSVADTNVDLAMVFAVNVDKEGRIYPLNVIRDWCRLIYNSDGIVLTKEEYAGAAVIEVHNVKGEILRKVKIPIFFPMTNIAAMKLDYHNDEIFELPMTWVAENAADTYID